MAEAHGPPVVLAVGGELADSSRKRGRAAANRVLLPGVSKWDKSGNVDSPVRREAQEITIGSTPLNVDNRPHLGPRPMPDETGLSILGVLQEGHVDSGNDLLKRRRRLWQSWPDPRRFTYKCQVLLGWLQQVCEPCCKYVIHSLHIKAKSGSDRLVRFGVLGHEQHLPPQFVRYHETIIPEASPTPGSATGHRPLDRIFGDSPAWARRGVTGDMIRGESTGSSVSAGCGVRQPQRGRFSVPIPAVMNSAVAVPSTSAVCHTPGGLMIASPLRIVVRRTSLSIFW